MMKKFFRAVVNHPKMIVMIFLVVTVLCAGCKQLVAVDYDMTDYLPEDSPFTVAMRMFM